MTSPRRVLHVQPVAERGGSDLLLLAMVRQLAADGWECHVALPAPSPLTAEFQAAGAHLHVVPMRRITTSATWRWWVAYAIEWPVAVLRLAAVGRREGVDVVHSNSLHTWYGWAAALLLRRPHVWHAREIVVQSGAALALERFLAHRFAARVVAVSRAVAAQLHPANVVVVEDEADPQRFSPDRAGRFRAAAGIDDGVALVSAASRIDTWKGVDVLLDAVPLIQAARPGTEVVVVGPAVAGKEDYAARLAARAAALPGVHWLGPRDDVPEVMADSDVFVQASTEPEPFGMVIVEALASGAPVVATAAGGPVEILAAAPKGAGRLVPPRDPGALAEAVVDLLPPSSSADARRRRPRLRRGSPVPWSDVLGAVVPPVPTKPAQRPDSLA
jgi:glycosyltransferase involved in cell wall biosynthesis